MELVGGIILIILAVALTIVYCWVLNTELKKQKQRDEWLKSIADDVKFLTTEAVNYEKK